MTGNALLMDWRERGPRMGSNDIWGYRTLAHHAGPSSSPFRRRVPGIVQPSFDTVASIDLPGFQRRDRPGRIQMISPSERERIPTCREGDTSASAVTSTATTISRLYTRCVRTGTGPIWNGRSGGLWRRGQPQKTSPVQRRSYYFLEQR